MKKGCAYQPHSSQISFIARTGLLQLEITMFLGFFSSDEVHFDFGIKAIVRWKLISFPPWEHTAICFIAYFLLSLKSCVVAAGNIISWMEREEIVEMGSKWEISAKDCTESSPAFLTADQTEFPLFEYKSSKILTHRRWSQKNLPYVEVLIWLRTRGAGQPLLATLISCYVSICL